MQSLLPAFLNSSLSATFSAASKLQTRFEILLTTFATKNSFCLYIYEICCLTWDVSRNHCSWTCVYDSVCTPPFRTNHSIIWCYQIQVNHRTEEQTGSRKKWQRFYVFVIRVLMDIIPYLNPTPKHKLLLNTNVILHSFNKLEFKIPSRCFREWTWV